MKKNFKSIENPRRGIPSGGVVPRNRLTSSPTRITPEDPRKDQDIPIDEINHDQSASAVERSRVINRQIEEMNHSGHALESFSREKPITNRVHNLIRDRALKKTMPVKKRMKDDNKQLDLPPLYDISRDPVDKLAIQYSFAHPIKSLRYQHRRLILLSITPYYFCISSTAPILYVATFHHAVAPYIFHRHHVARILFGENEVILELKYREGIDKYVLLTHNTNDTYMRNAFKELEDWANTADTDNIVTKATVDNLKKQARPGRKDSTADFSPRRSARLTLEDSGKTSGGNEPEVVLEMEARQHPVNFKPPLLYSFHADDPIGIDVGDDPERRGKTICVTQQDFNTLYNNEWVNDIIIDFFVSYEIAEAKRRGKLGGGSIYSFNSFFYTKLIQKSDNGGPPPYYTNVKRWLMRMDKDLMSYDLVVMPINELSHWYVCVIRGLPQLLARAKRVALQGLEERSLFETKSELPLNVEKAEVFVLDSLNNRHSSILIPLKRLIIDYCEDIHHVAIQKAWIYMKNASVPKQNNFNDCGIHVIFNIRTWLNDTEVVERYWRERRRGMVTEIFGYDGQKSMRQQLIDALLKLHRDEYGEQHETHNNEIEDNGADLDLEELIIEVSPTPSATPIPEEPRSVEVSEVDRHADANFIQSQNDHASTINDLANREIEATPMMTESTVTKNDQNQSFPSHNAEIEPIDANESNAVNELKDANESSAVNESKSVIKAKGVINPKDVIHLEDAIESKNVIKLDNFNEHVDTNIPNSSQTCPSDPIDASIGEPKGEENDIRFTSQESVGTLDDPIDSSSLTNSQPRRLGSIEMVNGDDTVEIDSESSPEPEVGQVQNLSMTEESSANSRKRRASPEESDSLSVIDKPPGLFNASLTSPNQCAVRNPETARKLTEVSFKLRSTINKKDTTKRQFDERSLIRKGATGRILRSESPRNVVESQSKPEAPYNTSKLETRMRPRHQQLVILDTDDEDDADVLQREKENSMSDINTSVNQLALDSEVADKDKVVEEEQQLKKKRQRRL